MNLLRSTRHLVAALVLIGTALVFSAAVAAPPAVAGAAKQRDPDAFYRSEIVPFLKKHCVECHGADAQEGDVRLDQYKDAAAVSADEKTWQRTIQMLRSGAMPPDDAVQPSEQQRRAIVNWIERTTYKFDCDNIADPGHVTIRRLNRAEYNNTIRDLHGI